MKLAHPSSEETEAELCQEQGTSLYITPNTKGCKFMAYSDFDWFSNSENDWKSAWKQYWSRVQHEDLEKEMYHLDLQEIKKLSAEEWYAFLYEKYFKWKYTAPNRLATTRKNLKKYQTEGKLEELYNIKNQLLSINPQEISIGLSIAQEIHGLGVAGASGLLALMYPKTFACVDQFVVKALRNIHNLPERDEVNKIKENCIELKYGVLLIGIMQRKAEELNRKFSTSSWTPRKIDMLLWGIRQK